MSATNNISVINLPAAMRSFICDVCTEECTEPRYALDYQLCIDCAGMVAGYFKDALQHEHSYPPRWGDQTIPLEPFLDLLPQDFELNYASKKKEYDTPPAKRLYCERRKRQDNSTLETGSKDICGNFLGEKSSLNQHGHPVIICPQCHEMSCTDCGSLESIGHVCEQSEQPKDPFAELIRGKDYQVCPNADCGLKVQLWDGCNHLRCTRCTQELCRICGKEAEDGSDHWTREGGCPRWNHPDDGNAVFDAEQTVGPPTLGAVEIPEWPAWAQLEPEEGVVATVDLDWAREDFNEIDATGVYLRRLLTDHIADQTPPPAWVEWWPPMIHKMLRSLEIILTLDQEVSADERISQQVELIQLWDPRAHHQINVATEEIWHHLPDFERAVRRFSDRLAEAEALLDYDVTAGEW